MSTEMARKVEGPDQGRGRREEGGMKKGGGQARVVVALVVPFLPIALDFENDKSTQNTLTV